MKAYVLEMISDLAENPSPLRLREYPVPVPREHDILIRISACGVCHTEIDEIEGRASAILPVIPGHQAVGRVEETGSQSKMYEKGDRVGVAWIFSACGECDLCTRGLENLCTEFCGTGMHADGGYAEYMIVSEKFAHRIPDIFSDYEAAPLLCAGAIGFRSLQLTGMKNGDILGLTGFGGSGHLVLKMVRSRYPESKVYVFARNPDEQSFALELGASWAGDISESAPEPIQAIIDTTPAWKPMLASLEKLSPGGRLVINAIRKEKHDLNTFMELDYAKHLWKEKEIKSVANVTRNDVKQFLEIASKINIKPYVELYPFEEANRALYDLKTRKVRGAKVLLVR